MTIQPKTKLAAFDIDGTLFRWQLGHQLIYELKLRGYFDEASMEKIDESFFSWKARDLSFEEYERVLVTVMDTNVQKIPPSVIEEIAPTIVKKSGHKVYKYTRDYIKQLQADGYHVLAISGSQHEIVTPFTELYGFDDCIGSLYERTATSDAFTGKISRFVPGNKAQIITEYAKQHGFDMKDSVAVGDSEGDISMLKIVDKPLAFNPSHELLAIAMQNRWPIVIERKNVAYQLQWKQDGTYILAKADRI